MGSGSGERQRVRHDELIWRVIDGEAVVVHTETSAYFGLNASGTALWVRLASSPATPDELGDELVSLFGRSSTEARADVEGFLQQAAEHGLIAPATASDDPPPARIDEVPAPRGPYETPNVVRFGDLETLVLSGE